MDYLYVQADNPSYNYYMCGQSKAILQIRLDHLTDVADMQLILAVNRFTGKVKLKIIAT